MDKLKLKKKFIFSVIPASEPESQEEYLFLN